MNLAILPPKFVTYVCTLFCALFDASIAIRHADGIDVTQMGYACIMIVCMYRHAGSTGSTIHVCIHACMHVLCMHVCYAIRRHSLLGTPIGELPACMHVLYIYMYVCLYVIMYIFL